MKRFDYAADVAKQLITIASAVVTVAFAFYDKIFSHSLFTRIAMILVLGIFVLSILFGIFSLGGLVTLVDRQERLNSPITGRLPNRPLHVRLSGSQAERYAQEQQIAFMLGLLLFLLLALFDGVLSGPPTQPPSSSTSQSVP